MRIWHPAKSSTCLHHEEMPCCSSFPFLHYAVFCCYNLHKNRALWAFYRCTNLGHQKCLQRYVTTNTSEALKKTSRFLVVDPFSACAQMIHWLNFFEIIELVRHFIKWSNARLQVWATFSKLDLSCRMTAKLVWLKVCSSFSVTVLHQMSLLGQRLGLTFGSPNDKFSGLPSNTKLAVRQIAGTVDNVRHQSVTLGLLSPCHTPSRGSLTSLLATVKGFIMHPPNPEE